MASTFLLYGATGYTAGLICRLAVSRGLRPVLAGRDPEKVPREGARFDLPYRVFGLDDPETLDAALEDVAAVLHCAGPFAATARPMVDACLRTGTHYLDISGEVTVFESLARRDAEARRARVMLLPGTGFEVAASDCLAVHLKMRLPSAARLALGIYALENVSRGTVKTLVENLGRAGLVRRECRLEAVPVAWKTRDLDFGWGAVPAVTVPAGDLAAAFRSTGIQDIEVYVGMTNAVRWVVAASRPLWSLMRSPELQRLLHGQVAQLAAGPTDDARKLGSSFVWGEVEDDAGQRRISRLRCPDTYTVTAQSALNAVEHVLAGQAPPGFQTPGMAFGPDFILDVEGAAREDLEWGSPGETGG